ncbi:MAG: GIY-YIG nuclease family protein [Hyphomicrobiaceae bacterium]|nr:GIY-YIG nuclease family protein [Hyphomicrobiaceae bacterium]
MDKKFASLVERLHPKFEILINMAPVTKDQLPKGISGIYLFSEQEPLYVGRSNDIKGRYGRHCNPGATHRMAAFAFRLARKETGNLVAAYQKGKGTRDELAKEPEFKEAFEKAKARIRKMEYRYVEEQDPLTQCLLEIYAAVALQTLYNDFDNH